jgi:hypothetical protein
MALRWKLKRLYRMDGLNKQNNNNIDKMDTKTIKVDLNKEIDVEAIVKQAAKAQKEIIYDAFKNASPDVEKELYAILHAPLVKVEFFDE